MALRFRSYQTKRSTTVSPLQTATRLARSSKLCTACSCTRFDHEASLSWRKTNYGQRPRGIDLARASRKNLGCRYQRMPAIGPEVDASWSLSIIRLCFQVTRDNRRFSKSSSKLCTACSCTRFDHEASLTSGTKFTRRLGKSPVVPGDLKAMPPRLVDGCR
jgi:hypothetical protein